MCFSTFWAHLILTCSCIKTRLAPTSPANRYDAHTEPARPLLPEVWRETILGGVSKNNFQRLLPAYQPSTVSVQHSP